MSLTFASVAVQAQRPAAKSRIEYKAGQSWRYAGDGATITILKVEDLPKMGRVVHVRIDNITLPACGGIHLTKAIDHVAVTEKMMSKSVSDLFRENEELPDSYFEGYREWQRRKKPEVVKNATIEEVVKRNFDMPLICNFLPGKTA